MAFQGRREAIDGLGRPSYKKANMRGLNDDARGW